MLMTKHETSSVDEILVDEFMERIQGCRPRA